MADEIADAQDSVDVVTSSLAEIVYAIEETADGAVEIASGTDEQAAASEEITG